ncbi:MAG: hypothetical protein U5L96_05805 [Owenweeksia sp.]|nr:hypothetical protein [Owenweeksia sp.]
MHLPDEELGSYLGKDASTPRMPPIAIYYKWDEENNQVVFEPAMVVESNKPGTDQIHKAMTHGGMALKAVHKGGWDTETSTWPWVMKCKQKATNGPKMPVPGKFM